MSRGCSRPPLHPASLASNFLICKSEGSDNNMDPSISAAQVSFCRQSSLNYHQELTTKAVSLALPRPAVIRI